jgi:preprotein translocase subunit SecA
MPHADKHAAYAADITYGTNNEFGFDYLRDNMAMHVEERYQRGLPYAIVDEVDSILIDEARTPLIISGPADDSPELYIKVDAIVPSLARQEKEDSPGDYWVDEKQKQVHLSEAGQEHAEVLLRQAGIIAEEDSLYAAQNIHVVHHLNAALRAHALYQADVDYIVRDGEVIIVDEFTGRTLPGRRWSDGLHQAVEAKERVPVQRENQTLASVTFQNLFRMYKKLSGMTGTADTEAYEFQNIYGLEVVVIPTHRPMVRKDHSDLVFLNRAGKYRAVVREIKECVERGQPVLVGTTSIEVSELLGEELRAAGIAHEVLNAKQHEREAHIIAQAGRPGAVTIATNMAGRGTDIVLGGSLEAELADLEAQGPVDDSTRARLKAEWQQRHDAVKAAGGLHIIGTERHESRRIDNQLRGRSGRQGDPGSSRFYLSMEDNLMRIFGDPNRTKKWLAMAGMKEGEVIESGMLTRQIEKAQRKVEAHNFDVRKQLLTFDDVANDQRKVIYQQRTELMGAENLGDAVRGIRAEVVSGVLDQYLPSNVSHEEWNLAGLAEAIEKNFATRVDPAQWLKDQPDLEEEVLRGRIIGAIDAMYDAKVARIGLQPNGVPIMRHIEKDIMLKVLDQQWRDHLGAMDYLRQGIHLRGYAQKDYRYEYKREAFELFAAMLDRIKFDTVTILATLDVQIKTPEQIEREEEARRARLNRALQMQHAEAASLSQLGPSGEPQQPQQPPPGARQAPPRQMPPQQLPPQQPVRAAPKVGRNQPCPCGSGKKFKNCHGVLEGVE